MRKLLLLTCLLFLAGGSALPGQAADVAPIWDGPLPANADYQVGNLNQPEGPPLEGYFDGHQMIAYFIAPREQCDCPEGGFKLESVNHLLYFADLQEPAVFSVRAGLLAAEYDQSTASWVPGQILCESLPMTVTIQEPGIQQVQVPTAECESMSLEENYFLYLAYEIGVPAGLVVDGLPQSGIEYLDRGNGWEDMFYFPDKSGGGKHIVWGDVLCSEPVVPAEASSFDSIKAMFR